MHNRIIMCQRDNHPDSTKIYKKIQVHVHQDVLNKEGQHLVVGLNWAMLIN
jgi:hypothetical protein